MGHFFFFSSTNVETKNVCPIAYNVKAFVSGGHRCKLLSTASCPPACTNAVLAAVFMTERKQLKKKLAKLKHYKANLPRLIDCSNVYGDDYYSKDDLSDVDKQIEKVEKQIAEIDRLSENGV